MAENSISTFKFFYDSECRLDTDADLQNPEAIQKLNVAYLPTAVIRTRSIAIPRYVFIGFLSNSAVPPFPLAPTVTTPKSDTLLSPQKRR